MGFLDKANLPSLEGGSGPVKVSIISLFPYQPCSNNKDIHEKFAMKLNTGLLHHGMKVKIKTLVDSQMSPALPTKVAGEEKMKSYLIMICAHDTTVVIPLQFVLLSSQDVSNV
jgi:hypothetical protein